MSPSRHSARSGSTRARARAAGVRACAAFAAAMGRQDLDAARAALRRARTARTPRRALEETALMLMLYAGYPAALEALRVLHAEWPGRARPTREGSPREWNRRGRALCARVYGPAFVRLVPAVEALHPDLATWMIEHGYGRVLSRPGLGARERELVTVAALAALGWERQLVSHVLGARRLGAPVAEVERALRAGLTDAPARAWRAATRAWEALCGDAGARALARAAQPARAGRIERRPAASGTT